jgi:hypothetical protein
MVKRLITALGAILLAVACESGLPIAPTTVPQATGHAPWESLWRLASAEETTSAYLFAEFTLRIALGKALYSRVMQVLHDTGVLVKGGPMPPLEPAYAPAG